MNARRWWWSVLLAGSLAWAGTVLGHYYAQLGHLQDGFTPLLVPLWSGDPWLYYLSEAFPRGVSGVVGAGVLLLAATLVGVGLCRRLHWQFQSRPEAFAIAPMLGILIFGLLGLALALGGWYRSGPLQWVVCIGAGIGLWLARAGRNPVVVHGTGRGGRRHGDGEWKGLAMLFGACAFLAALAPQWEYDAVWYHLYFPRLFLEQGRLVDVPTEYVSLYPMTWSLWYGYGLAFGGQAAATLLHWACLPLTASLVYAIVRRDVPQASAWMAVALFAATPIVLWEASVAYLDLAMAWLATIAVFALLRCRQTSSRQWFWVGALSLGLAAASKHLALLFIALAGIAMGWCVWQRDRRFLRALRAAVGFAAVALLVTSPWYLRSWLATGNPVFPELTSVFGSLSDRWGPRTETGLARFMTQFGHGRSAMDLLRLPWNMTVHAVRYAGTVGPLFLVLLPLVALRRLRAVTGALLLAAASYFILWASPISSFQMRWLVPLIPLAAVLAALSVSRLQALGRATAGRLGTGIISAGLFAALLLQLPWCTPMHERDRSGWNGWLTHTLRGLPLAVVLGGESADRYLQRYIPTWQAWSKANRILPDNAVVLSWSGGDNFYSRPRRLSVFATQLRSAVWSPPAELPRALETLRAWHVTHLLIDKQFLRRNGFEASASWEDFGLTCAATKRQWYTLLHEDWNAQLYQINWPQAGNG